MAVVAFGEWLLALTGKAGKAFATHRWVAVPVAALVVVMVVTSCSSHENKADSTPSPSASASSPKATPSATKAIATPSKKVDTSVLQKVVRDALHAAGFKSNQYKMGDVKKDTTPAGSDVFSSKPIVNGQEMATFLKSGTKQAKTVMADAEKATGATAAELEEPANWVATQFKVPIKWPGNTYYLNGNIVKAQVAKTDEAGSTMLAFVPPRQVAAGKVTSIYEFRGSCVNPQTTLPVPAPPTPPKVTPPAPKPPAPVPPTTRPCTQPWYAYHAGYKEIGPCQWVKDLVKNTYDCQQNWHTGCPGTGGWVQPPQSQTTAQSSATSRATATSTTVPKTAPSSAPTTTSVVTGTPVIGSTATPTTNPSTCPFGQTSC